MTADDARRQQAVVRNERLKLFAKALGNAALVCLLAAGLTVFMREGAARWLALPWLAGAAILYVCAHASLGFLVPDEEPPAR